MRWLMDVWTMCVEEARELACLQVALGGEATKAGRAPELPELIAKAATGKPRLRG